MITSVVYSADKPFVVYSADKPCEAERYMAVFSGGFLPVCTPEGLYDPVQCHKGECWCVSKDTGEEIANTRTYDATIPNCDCEYIEALWKSFGLQAALHVCFCRCNLNDPIVSLTECRAWAVLLFKCAMWLNLELCMTETA